MNSKLLIVGLTTTTLFSFAQADLFGVYSNIRTYATTSDGAPDTHQYFGYSAVPFFAGHSEATFDDGLVGASAIGDTLATYGSLHVDEHGSSYNTAGKASLAVVTQDGNPSAATSTEFTLTVRTPALKSQFTGTRGSRTLHGQAEITGMRGMFRRD